MSASLVGSEMCIRDRLLTGRGTADPKTRHSLPTTAASGALAAPLGMLAVSYTHLTLPTICSV
eukprot:6668725-Alexandrium_andersonii.AAC.1